MQKVNESELIGKLRNGFNLAEQDLKDLEGIELFNRNLKFSVNDENYLLLFLKEKIHNSSMFVYIKNGNEYELVYPRI